MRKIRIFADSTNLEANSYTRSFTRADRNRPDRNHGSTDIPERDADSLGLRKDVRSRIHA